MNIFLWIFFGFLILVCLAAVVPILANLTIILGTGAGGIALLIHGADRQNRFEQTIGGILIVIAVGLAGHLLGYY